jgi:LysR family transcriptional regulator, regulator of abg operon
VIRLGKLTHFITVAESGSIGAAARRLGLSQPALTKSLRALEAELQVLLVDRTARGARLTRYGRTLYARARTAQNELARAEEEVRALAGGRSGSVAFGFGPVAAKAIVPEAVSAFRRQFPDSAVRLMEGFVHQLVPLVRDGALDFAVGPGLPEFRADASFKFKAIFHYERVVVARLGHPLVRSRSLRDVSTAEWLTFEPQGSLEQLFARLGLAAPRAVVQSDSADATIELLARTDMLGILPRPMPGADARLAIVPVREPLPPFTVGLFVSAHTPLTRAAQVMSRLVTEVGRRVAASGRTSRQ